MNWRNNIPGNLMGLLEYAELGGVEGWTELVNRQAEMLDSFIPSKDSWRCPVGQGDFPAGAWYAATVHDLTGKRNNPNYPHSGLDLNLDKSPWGNVDVGQPVFCITDAKVVDVGFSQKFRGGIVLKVDHYGQDLYVRYWHLQEGIQRFSIGDFIPKGKELGRIDYYPNGYAHCHIDMFWQPIMSHWWFTKHPEIECANPTWILKTHVFPVTIDAMLAKGN